MAVTRAPKRVATLPEDERAVLEVIQRGGTVKADHAAGHVEEDPLKNVQLRLYQSVLDEIDDVRRQHARGRRPISRHAWIVEAVEEKLRKERRK